MFATNERVNPCSARFSRSSSGRVTISSSPSRVIAMLSGASCSSVPFGPVTVTRVPSSVTSTPLGIGMGFLPMRDMGRTPLPDLAEDLAAHAALTRFAVGHESLVGREDRDAHAAEDTGHRIGLGVHAQARLRDAPEAGDRALAVGRVLQLDLQLLT